MFGGYAAAGGALMSARGQRPAARSFGSVNRPLGSKGHRRPTFVRVQTADSPRTRPYSAQNGYFGHVCAFPDPNRPHVGAIAKFRSLCLQALCRLLSRTYALCLFPS